MSCRHKLFDLSTADGQRMAFFRDCDTQRYRLFIDEIPQGGRSVESARADLDEQEFVAFCEALAAAAEKHTPFDGEPT